MHDSVHHGLIELLEQLCSLAEVRGEKIYFVGGVIRDLLLNRSDALRDLDVVVEGDGAGLAARFAEITGGELKVFSKFLTAKVIFAASSGDDAAGCGLLIDAQRDVDFVSTRSEHYLSAGELPTVKLGDFASDIWRRDFSINALACPVRALIGFLKGNSSFLDQVVDLTGGLNDLQLRQMRVLHDQSFIDDPTRMFRACRYAARIGGALEPHTLTLFKKALREGACETVSYQRRLVEMRKLVEEVDPKAAIKFVVEIGLLDKSGLICEGAGGKFLAHFLAAEALLSKDDKLFSEGLTLWGISQHLLLYHAIDERALSGGEVSGGRADKGGLAKSPLAHSPHNYTKKAGEIATAIGWRKKRIAEVLSELESLKFGAGHGVASPMGQFLSRVFAS